jgi:hypothetical protein
MDVALVDFGYALAAELWENVEAQWAQPSAGRSIPFELRLSPFKHSHGEFFQSRILAIALGYFVAAFGIADCDRVTAGCKFAFPLITNLSRWCEVRGRHVA